MLGVFTAVWLVASPSAVESSEADRLFESARTLVNAGKFAEACPLFERSLAVDEALGTLLNLADCQLKLGRTATAFNQFTRVVEWAQTTKDSLRKAAAQKQLDGLREKLSVLVVHAPEGATVLVDGVARAAAVTGLPVDPGPHEIVVERPQRLSWRSAITALSGPSRLEVMVPPMDVLEHPVAPPPALEALTPPAARTTRRVAGTVVGGAGVAVLVAGLIGIGHSVGVRDALARQQPGGPDYNRPSVSSGDVVTAQGVYPTSWVAVVLGAAATATGTILFATPPPPNEGPQ